jgi:hypothetical protein
MMRSKYTATEERTRAEDKIETNGDGTHLDSITWWGEYDLTPIINPSQTWFHI